MKIASSDMPSPPAYSLASTTPAAGGAVSLLSVVSVVKDDPEGLDRTLTSLAANALDDAEIVVIDGSADRDEIPAVLQRHSAIPVHYAWREPRGVFPAMNDGLTLAEGEYLLFLNAGDVLAGPDVLQSTAEVLTAQRPLWAFGRVRFMSGTEQWSEPAWDYASERDRSFARGRFPPHQGVFVRADELRRQGGFDTSYRIVADYTSMLKCSLRADPVVLDLAVAEFAVGGLSWTQWRPAQAEFHRARREVLQPKGWRGLKERWDTLRGRATTGAYRMLHR
jgi:glycosyltransferase involved in cell wall biosynthesis